MQKSDYPWQQHAAGESFFVPCLDVGRVLQEGLAAGHKLYGPDAPLRGQVGVFEGQLGVLFTVRRRRQRPDTSDSQPPA